MDWAFIFKVIAVTFLFLAVEALVVHLYIKKHGGNWGRLILKGTKSFWSSRKRSCKDWNREGCKCTLLTCF